MTVLALFYLRLKQLLDLIFAHGSTIENNQYDSKICVKGGDWKVPNFILNNDLEMRINKDSSDYTIGIRIIKDKLE